MEWHEEELSRRPSDEEVLIRSTYCALKHGTEFTRITGSSPFAAKSFDETLRLFVEVPSANGFPSPLGNTTVGLVEGVGSRVGDIQSGQTVFGPLPAAEFHLCPASSLTPLGSLTADQARAIDPAMFGLGGASTGVCRPGNAC
jgi:threonine dehydrogenase-like Zn-dependent dehydrogenase